MTDAVHAKGSFIILQLWAIGRTADPEVAKQEGIVQVGASDIPLSDYKDSGVVPRPLTKEEIAEYPQKFVHAAKNAIAAGFDG